MPDPAIPASPTISPGRASKLTSIKPVPTVNPSTTSDAPPASTLPVRSGKRSSCFVPTIASTTSGIVRAAVSRVRISRPSRITVTRSAIWKTSSRRCDTYSTVIPSPASSRRIANSRCVSRSLSAELGSSRISTLGCSQQHSGQLDQLSLGDRHGPDRDVEVDIEAEPGEHRAGAPLHLPGGDEAEAGRLAVDEQVGQQRAIGKDAQLLVDDSDAVAGAPPEPTPARRLDRRGRSFRRPGGSPRRAPSSASTCRPRSRRRWRGSSPRRPRGPCRRRRRCRRTSCAAGRS